MATTTKFVLLPLVSAIMLSISACGGGGGGGKDGAAPATNGTISGKAVDGYLNGSTVFCDTNNNDAPDSGEMSTTTDVGGNFKFSTPCSSTIVVVGGIDESTKHKFSGLLKAKSGSTVVTPLTSLLVDSGMTPAQLAKSLGLPDGTDVTKIDPKAPGNAYIHKKTLMAQQVIQQLANVLGAGSNSADIRAIYSSVAKILGKALITSPTPFITDAGVNATIIKDVAIVAAGALGTSLSDGLRDELVAAVASQTNVFFQTPESDLDKVAVNLQDPSLPPVTSDFDRTNYLYAAGDQVLINGEPKSIADFVTNGVSTTGLNTLTLNYGVKNNPATNMVVDIGMTIVEKSGTQNRVFVMKIEKVEVTRSGNNFTTNTEDTKVNVYAANNNTVYSSIFNNSFSPLTFANNQLTVDYQKLIERIANDPQNPNKAVVNALSGIKGNFDVTIVVHPSFNMRYENGKAFSRHIMGFPVHKDHPLALKGVAGPGISGNVTIN